MKYEQYTREQLLEILCSYKRMINNNKNDYPTVLIDDLEKSITHVLEKNNYKEDITNEMV